jgi:hypothetical protein
MATTEVIDLGHHQLPQLRPVHYLCGRALPNAHGGLTRGRDQCRNPPAQSEPMTAIAKLILSLTTANDGNDRTRHLLTLEEEARQT